MDNLEELQESEKKLVKAAKENIKKTMFALSQNEQQNLFADMFENITFQHNVKEWLQLFEYENGISPFSFGYNDISEAFDEELMDFILRQERTTKEGLFKKFREEYSESFKNVESLKLLFNRQNKDDNEKLVKSFITYLLKVKRYFLYQIKDGKYVKNCYFRKSLRFMSEHSVILIFNEEKIDFSEMNLNFGFSVIKFAHDIKKFKETNYILRKIRESNWVLEYSNKSPMDFTKKLTLQETKNNSKFCYNLIQKVYNEILKQTSKQDCYYCGDSRNENARCDRCNELVDLLAKLVIISQEKNIITDKQSKRDNIRKIAKNKKNRAERLKYFIKKLNDTLNDIRDKKINTDINVEKQDASSMIKAFEERIKFTD